MKQEPISISQKFNVSKQDLFKAWTDEAALKVWWKPAGRSLSSLENNIEEGGEVIYKFDNDDESTGQLEISGRYHTALPEEKLVYSWNWVIDSEALENGNYQLTIEFKDSGEGSEISIVQENKSEHQGIHPHAEGWQEALKALKAYLEEDQITD